jgi:hypothetical protein
MEALEVFPEGVRWIGEAAVSEGVSREKVAELIGNARLGNPRENRYQGAGAES